MPDSIDPKLETPHFKLADIMYTRTEKRGVIQSANEKFCEVSGYAWSELVGAPHKLVRHKQMPKVIFRLMWDTIKSGQKLGAYVVNQCKDGDHYWVFAIALPVEDGYISVRIKPTSPGLEAVKTLYAQLRADEEADDFNLDTALTQFHDQIQSMGYENYLDFMARSLREELTARNTTLGESIPEELETLSQIQKSISDVSTEVATVTSLFERSKQVPYNMRLQAGRLEGSDGPISVVSSNHRIITQNLTEQIDRFNDAAQLGGDPVREASFMTSVSAVMDVVVREMSAGDDEGDWAKGERTTMQDLRTGYRDEVRQQVVVLSRRLGQFSNMCRTFRRSLSGLEMTRIMCEIERSKIAGDTAGLDEITGQLMQTEKDMGAAMSRLEATVARLVYAANGLTEGIDRAA